MYREQDAIARPASSMRPATAHLHELPFSPVDFSSIDFAGAPAAEAAPRMSMPARFIKRLFDWISVVVILALFWWAILLVAIGVKLTSPGPVIYGHTRIGRGGREFKCYKFRSMVVNSDQVLRDLLASNPEASAEWHRDFKLKDDPRITRVGRLIRKTSFDEFPQLINVIKGEMSIVGPRPVVRKELENYYGSVRRHYESVRPGLTGLWQVSGRNDMGYDQRVELDRRYVNTWNVFTDLMIVMRTVGVMFARKGAY